MADVTTFFSDDLPRKISENPDMAKEINAVLEFNIDWTSHIETWTVDFTQGGTVTKGSHSAPDCVVSIGSEDFYTLLKNPAAGMRLFTQGKLKVSNIALAMSLTKIVG
jgi:hypothetical protein